MNIDFKMLIAVVSLVIGVILVLGPKLKEWLSIKSNPAADFFQAVVNTEKQKKETEADLDCLEGLVRGLDQTENKEQIDMLIDKVAPSLIRQRLKKK